MSKVHVYTRSLLSTWTGYMANLLVAFFLTRFVVGSLGSEVYGVWSLLMQVTGYLGLVEIGVRVSTGRYVNLYLGRNEPEKVSQVVCTSLAFYSGASLLILAAAGVLGLYFGAIFTKVPAEMAAQAVWLLLILGANVWVGLFASTFGQCLNAYNRFDLRNACDLMVLAARASGTVWVLSAGYGLMGLSLVLLGSSLLGLVLVFGLSRWKGPSVSLSLAHVSGPAMKEIFGFGAWAFVYNVSGRIIHYTDALVIGKLISLAAVTFFSISMMLVDAARIVVGQAVSVLTPDLTKAAGRRDMAALRWLVIQGTRVAMFLAMPLMIGVMTFGSSFLGLWMGPEFAKVGGPIVLVLAIAHMFPLYSRACGAALWGLGYVKEFAVVSGIEAAINLGLSVLFVLAFGWGINGVALGTLVPMVTVTTSFATVYCCRKTGMRLRFFLARTIPGPAAAGVVFAGMCLIARRVLPPTSWSAFWIDVLVVAVAYVPVGVLTIFGRAEGARLMRRALQFVKAPTSE